jgi:hypothetical protein
MRRFKDLFRESGVEPVTPSSAADTLKQKPHKEPIHKLKEENDTTEKVEMIQSQLHFIKYACEEILEFIDEGGEVEEWYQVKVAKTFSEFESLHSYIEGESRRTGMKEDVQKYPFVAHHIKKGMHQTHGSTSYEAAQNAAKHWKMKNTSGISVYRADKKHVAEETEQLDELSKDTLRSYIPKSFEHGNKLHNQIKNEKDPVKKAELQAKLSKRNIGIMKAGKKINEDFEILDEENKPTNPELWSRAVSMAKQKFDVYPSAYANGWAAKWYKSKGGDWKSVNEDAKKDNDPPFTPDKSTKRVAVPGKYGIGPSTAKHLAKTGLKSTQQNQTKKQIGESRKAEIVREIVKKKKHNKENNDTFEKEPIMTNTISKE